MKKTLLIMASACFLIATMACSCTGGQTSTRSVIGMACFDDGYATAGFCYEGFWDGSFQIIKIGGLPMPGTNSPAVYMVPVKGGIEYEYRQAAEGYQWQESDFVTNASGVCKVELYYDMDKDPIAQIYPVTTATTLHHPVNSNIDGTASGSVWAGKQSVIMTANADSHLSASDIPPDVIESTFLDDEIQTMNTVITQSPPSHGIVKVSETLAYQAGTMGQLNAQPLDYVIPSFFNSPETLFTGERPKFYSITFKSAEPIVWPDGFVLQAKICASVSVDLYETAHSADNMTHSLRTETFIVGNNELLGQYEELPIYDQATPFDNEPNLFDPKQYEIIKRDNWLDCVDPNLYSDPNIIPDPNVFYDPDCLCMHEFHNRLDPKDPLFNEILIPDRIQHLPVISMDDGGQIWYEIDMNQVWLVLKAIDEGWLSDNKNYDVNGDGIVNLEDLNSITQQ